MLGSCVSIAAVVLVFVASLVEVCSAAAPGSTATAGAPGAGALAEV